MDEDKKSEKRRTIKEKNVKKNGRTGKKRERRKEGSQWFG